MEEIIQPPQPEPVPPAAPPTPQAPPEPKKSEIARIITDKLLIKNEGYECTLVKNRIISAEEQRHELESIVVKKGDKVIINLKKPADVRNFIDLCWNISMQLTREVAGVTQMSPPLTRPSQAPVTNHYLGTPDGTAIVDDTAVPDVMPQRPMRVQVDKTQNPNEIAEAFALMERARAERMGRGIGDENPYERIQRQMDSSQTMSQQLGVDGVVTEDQLSPQQRAMIKQIYGNVGDRLRVDDRAARKTADPIQGRTGPSKLKIMRENQKHKR